MTLITSRRALLASAAATPIIHRITREAVTTDMLQIDNVDNSGGVGAGEFVFQPYQTDRLVSRVSAGQQFGGAAGSVTMVVFAISPGAPNIHQGYPITAACRVIATVPMTQVLSNQWAGSWEPQAAPYQLAKGWTIQVLVVPLTVVAYVQGSVYLESMTP